VIQAAQAARAAQDVGEDPLAAAASAAIMGGMIGAPLEILGGALSRLGGVAGRTASGKIGNLLADAAEYGTLPEDRFVANAEGPRAIELPIEPKLKGALEAAREVEGKTPIGDMSVEGQHATIAKALNAVLDQKLASEPEPVVHGQAAPPAAGADWWNRHGPADEPIIEPGTALRPRVDENAVELPSAAEVAAGRVPPTPTDEANAVVRMQRAAIEHDALQAHVAAEQEQLRIEQAATARAAEKQGPLTLSQTIARASRDAEGETPDPLAVEYKEAINKYADALAVVKDAGENVGERAKLNLARTKSKLNEMREKYGRQVGGAALIALASADEELTDDEKKGVGIRDAALAGLGMAVIPSRMPVRLRELGRETIERAIRGAAEAGQKIESNQARQWLEFLEQRMPKLGKNYDRIQSALGEMVGHDWSKPLTIEQVARIFDEPEERAGLMSRGFTSRLRTFAETLPGKAWDAPRAAADWIGKLKGGGNFSKAEAGTVLPRLEALAGQKAKVTREEVLRLIDESIPQVDRTTLAEVPEPPMTEAERRARLTPDDRIEDIDEVEAGIGTTHFREELHEQVRAREDRVAEIRKNIEEVVDNYRREHESAQEEVSSARNEVRLTLQRIDSADADDVLSKIEEVLGDNVSSDDYDRAVEKAMEVLHEEVQVENERPDPEDLGWTIEDIPNPDTPDGEPWVRVTNPDGDESFEGPSKWEAMHQAELADQYDSAGKNGLMPDDVIFEHKPLPESWKVWYKNADGSRDFLSNNYVRESGKTDEEMVRMIRQDHGYSPDHYEIEHVPADAKNARWEARVPSRYGGEPRVVMSDADKLTREQFVDRFVDYHWEPKIGSEIFEELGDDIRRLARRMSSEMDAESSLYYRTEMQEDAFSDEYRQIDEINDELDRLRPLAANADPRPLPGEEPTEQAAPPARDPLLHPLPIESSGGVSYSTYQRIPGGTNYREMVNSWVNPKQKIPREAYGGHDYWSNKGVPNAIGHLRGEDHFLHDTPGLTGERVEVPGEDAPPRLREQYIEVAEVRARRNRALDKMKETEAALEALPADQTDPSGNISDEARSLLSTWSTLNNQVRDLGQREDALATEIRNTRGALLGENAPEPRKVLNILESQTSLSQHQAAVGGTKYTPDDLPQLRAQREEIVAERIKLGEERDKALKEMQRAEYEITNQQARDDSALREKGEGGFMSTTRQWLEDHGHPDLGDRLRYDFSVYYINEPSWKPVWDHLMERSPEWKKVIEDYRAAATAFEPARIAIDDNGVKLSAIDNAIQRAENYVDVAPFDEIANAQSYNAARAVIEWAEGDYDDLMWSDAANRIKYANLQRRAAKQWYDGVFGASIKRAFGYAGIKVDIEHVFASGAGHWRIRGTPEMRAKIRKYGVAPLTIAAMMANPDDAEAQDGTLHSNANLYGTFAGGVAAGALVMALANNRKLRSLVKENREVSRALMMDDLSGIANKTAHSRAIESVDRDPRTAWVAFDGDRFKQLNDTHGHPEGDKAIQHFGATLRAAAADLGVPMRGFRAGGDEFAFAVDKARAAEVLRYVEEHSQYTKEGVTTKLTGAIGDKWTEADALLKQTKNAARERDPSLAREFRPEVETKLNKIISDAMDQVPEQTKRLTFEEYMALPHEERMKYIDQGLADLKGGLAELDVAQQRMQRDIKRKLDLYSNPIGPALAELRRYPSAAGLAIVGTLMATESDDPNIQRAGVPVMALAALSAIGSARLGAGKDFLAAKLVEQLRKTPEGTTLTRAFNPDALLDPAVREAIIQFERDAARGKARAVEFSGKAKALGGEGDRAVSDVLEGEDWEDTAHMNAKQITDILSVAAELEKEYSDLTKAQVNAGTLNQASVLPNYGGPRRYAYFDALDALADSPSSFGKPGRRPKIAAVKQRTLDVPLREAEEALRTAHASGDQTAIQAAEDQLDQARVVQMAQRVQLGEIREASYRAAQGIERGHNNVAAAKLFDTIRNVPGSAHPEWVQAVDDLLTAKQMRASAVTQADKDAADLMFNESTVALDEVTRKYKQRGGEYVSLPDVPSLGVLRGAVVKRDIAHSLEGFGTPGLYGKTIKAWKEIKTVFNPGTSIGNILSNITALHMGEVPVWLQPYYLTQAAKDLRSYGEATRALAEAGVLNVNSVNALGTGELGAAMRKEQGLEELLPTTRVETQQVLRQQGITEERIRSKKQRRLLARMGLGATIGAAKGYDPEHPENAVTGAVLGAGAGAVFNTKAVRSIYDNEDNIARLAVFLRRRKLGDTVEQATESAIGSLGDFRSRSPALKLLSSTISPFILYQAKAVPAFARNVVDHPWKYMSLIAAWGAMDQMAQQEMGPVPESDVPVNQRKTYGYFFPGFTQLPFGDEKGNKAAVDVARWTPMSGLTTGAPPGSVPEAFGDNGMALVTPGGPVIDAALRGSNVDPYKKEPRLKRDRPTSENVGKVLNDAADFVLPSALGFHASRLKGDIDNADWTKFKNDLLGPTGIKPSYVRPGAVAMDAAFTLERSLRDMKQEFRVALRANKNPERVGELAKQYQTRVATALANFKDRIGTAPDPAIVDEYLTPEP
jgi:diguanylate cyclase (GGDEF)-like protein